MRSNQERSSVPDDMRIIKKYPNRRLYDTSSSSYVALVDIKQLILDGVPCCVVDAKTGSDLTRSILLQIILEEESDGNPLLTEPMLRNMIRFYGHALQGFMGSYLEKNVQNFIDFQTQLAGSSEELTPLPMMQDFIARYADQSRQVFTEIQIQMSKQTDQLMEIMRIKR